MFIGTTENIVSKNILIDSEHSEEIRVAVIDDGKLERYDFESTSKVQVKGNIYLAKVVRVEPSLQAAFVDYGKDRNGFLSFSEIHQDYFQIPVDDRADLEEHVNNAIAARAEELGVSVEELETKEVGRIRYQMYRRYKIQEVIKKRQIMLVQVTKEERGNKGASLTTYISLAGRYCVLMPNTEKSSGVSRKITNRDDRAKLKKIVGNLKVEHGSVVLRTAGIGHTKAEIGKDFEYLRKMWEDICKKTLKSTAPCLIHEEAGIIKRAIRDLYSREIESIFVQGKEGYKTAKSIMKTLMPSHAKKVQLYEDTAVPLFKKFDINDQIRQIYSTRVDLPSGGYLVINNTEALIAVDVNSGRATRERNISGTALKTNLEAATALARQCKLRDLAGLIVVDFIDMEDKRDNIKIEKCLKSALHDDKAKIQVGSITNFGLLEFSRQRLRSSIADANMVICPHCRGTGFIWSEESNAIQVLRRIEESCATVDVAEVRVTLSPSVALYIMNNKRSFLSNIEERNHLRVVINIDYTITALDFKIDPIVKHVYKDEDDIDGVPETEGMEISVHDDIKQNRGHRREIPISDGRKRPTSVGRRQSRQNSDEDGEGTASADSKVLRVKPRRKLVKNKEQSERNEDNAVVLENNTEPREEIKRSIRADSAMQSEKKSPRKWRMKKSVPETQLVKTEAIPAESQSDTADIINTQKASTDSKVENIEGRVFSSNFVPDNLDMAHLDYISHFNEMNEIFLGRKDQPIAKSISQDRKRRGWWQKLLKNPDVDKK